MNIVVDATYLISGIYINFCRLLWKKVWRMILRHLPWCSQIDDYRLVFIVSISLLRNILNARQSSIYEIVAYDFLDVNEKIHQFVLSVENRCT